MNPVLPAVKADRDDLRVIGFACVFIRKRGDFSGGCNRRRNVAGIVIFLEIILLSPKQSRNIFCEALRVI